MYKKLIFVTLLLVVPLTLFLYFQYYSVQKDDISPSEITTAGEIRESVNVFEGEQNRYSSPPLANPIVNESLGTRYGFTRLPELGGTGGEVWSLYGIQIDPPPRKITYESDQFGAAARALTSFSLDNRYLAFRTRWNYGIGEYDFRFMVFDLVDGQTITVRPPLSMRDILQKDQSLYLENYEWQGSAIQMIWYPLTPEKVGDDILLFRTTSKQLWQYDLETREYTFLREVKEMQ